jgi:hypothetical protein
MIGPTRPLAGSSGLEISLMLFEFVSLAMISHATRESRLHSFAGQNFPDEFRTLKIRNKN